MVKVNINISNKTTYTLIAIFSLLFISGLVYAYNSIPANPAVMGHSADEVKGTISESGEITVEAGVSFIEIAFTKTYNNPPLVLVSPMHGVPAGVGPNILTVTISNITKTNAWLDIDAVQGNTDLDSSTQISKMNYMVISRG
jgi:hypothetical protein